MNEIIYLLIEMYEDRKYLHCFFEKEEEAIEYCDSCNKRVIENHLLSWFSYEKIYNFKNKDVGEEVMLLNE